MWNEVKLLIMSDTHGNEEIIERVKGYHPDADKMIHCGDSELPYSHPAMQGMECVKGNCDGDPNYSEEILFQVNGDHVYVTHGHLYGVKASPMKLVYRAKELGASIVCFGHSHILGAEYIDDIFFINPGSLLKPRQIKEKTFVTLTVSPTHFTLDCYDDNNNLIEQICIER